MRRRRDSLARTFARRSAASEAETVPAGGPLSVDDDPNSATVVVDCGDRLVPRPQDLYSVSLVLNDTDRALAAIEESLSALQQRQAEFVVGTERGEPVVVLDDVPAVGASDESRSTIDHRSADARESESADDIVLEPSVDLRHVDDREHDEFDDRFADFVDGEEDEIARRWLIGG